MTFAIILGGFDLSVGADAALASVVGAKVMIEVGSRSGSPPRWSPDLPLGCSTGC